MIIILSFVIHAVIGGSVYASPPWPQQQKFQPPRSVKNVWPYDVDFEGLTLGLRTKNAVKAARFELEDQGLTPQEKERGRDFVRYSPPVGQELDVIYDQKIAANRRFAAREIAKTQWRTRSQSLAARRLQDDGRWSDATTIYNSVECPKDTPATGDNHQTLTPEKRESGRFLRSSSVAAPKLPHDVHRSDNTAPEEKESGRFLRSSSVAASRSPHGVRWSDNTAPEEKESGRFLRSSSAAAPKLPHGVRWSDDIASSKTPVFVKWNGPPRDHLTGDKRRRIGGPAATRLAIHSLTDRHATPITRDSIGSRLAHHHSVHWHGTVAERLHARAQEPLQTETAQSRLQSQRDIGV